MILKITIFKLKMTIHLSIIYLKGTQYTPPLPPPRTKCYLIAQLETKTVDLTLLLFRKVGLETGEPSRENENKIHSYAYQGSTQCLSVMWSTRFNTSLEQWVHLTCASILVCTAYFKPSFVHQPSYITLPRLSGIPSSSSSLKTSKCQGLEW